MALTIDAATEVTSELQEALASLLPQLNPALEGPTLAELAAVLADRAITVFVARENNAIVGTATVIVLATPARVKARIEDVVVDARSRGHGVGEALVSECVNVARKFGARVVEMESAVGRQEANRLYPRLGFVRRESNSYRKTLD